MMISGEFLVGNIFFSCISDFSSRNIEIFEIKSKSL